MSKDTELTQLRARLFEVLVQDGFEAYRSELTTVLLREETQRATVELCLADYLRWAVMYLHTGKAEDCNETLH